MIWHESIINPINTVKKAGAAPVEAAKFNPYCIKKSRSDEEQGAVCKLARERSYLRDQAICRLERRCSRLSFLAFERAFVEHKLQRSPMLDCNIRHLAD
jgi:hypothetical protein